MRSFGRVHIEVLVLIVIFALLAIAFYAYFSTAMNKGLNAPDTATLDASTTRESGANAPDSANGLIETMTLKGASIRATVVTTPLAQEKGLGGRSGLAADEGMLFVFPKDDLHAFWMKDMRFSIDIVWFDSDKKVIYVVKSVAPDTYPTAFGPQEPSRYVLELPAGWADAHGVKKGDIGTF